MMANPAIPASGEAAKLCVKDSTGKGKVLLKAEKEGEGKELHKEAEKERSNEGPRRAKLI